MKSRFAVDNQIVLVSGASRGIGRAIAAGFAAEGAQVIITGRDQQTLRATAAEIAPPAGTVTVFECDVAQPEAINRLVLLVLEQFGRIDTLINVAGVNRRKAAAAITEADYDHVLDINLKGAFLLSQAVGRRMIARSNTPGRTR